MRLSVDELVKEIRAAGTDNLGHFGNGYSREGGYSLQQNPDEFAAAVACIAELLPGDEHKYLEIGIASGGTLRFLAEHVGLSRIFAIDDRGHARAGEQAGNFDAMKIKPVVFYGNSHSKAARDWVRFIVGKVDLAFIDGDHSHDGCKQDLEMVAPFARYVMLHDTVACEGVKRTWDEAIAAKRLRAVLHVAGQDRPLGIGIAEVLR
jgi:hypothetical protein